jgi:hypothetical protein
MVSEKMPPADDYRLAVQKLLDKEDELKKLVTFHKQSFDQLIDDFYKMGTGTPTIVVFEVDQRHLQQGKTK